MDLGKRREVFYSNNTETRMDAGFYPPTDASAFVGINEVICMTAINLTFAIPGDPVPWARARLSGGRHYTAPKVAAYKRAVALMAQASMSGQSPAAGPVAISMRAVFTPPASWSARKRAQALAGEIHPTGKPDWDNLGKIVSDALSGVAYVDDAQVVRASVEKAYGANPGVYVHVARWEE